MNGRTVRRLLAVTLIALIGAGYSISQATAAHASSCSQGMYTREDSGINHNKYVGVSSSIDVTAQFSWGQAVIWYQNGGTSLFLTRDSSFLGETIVGPREKNLWGVSTRWTIFNPNWRSGTWIVYYVC
jgi:hypothetical protein